MDQLFMGLDSSTQSLSAVIIDPASRQVVCDESVNFDADLPEYNTENGVIPGKGDVVHSNPEMWLDALDLLLSRLKQKGVELSRVAGVSGSGQQHGSVYLTSKGLGRLKFLDASRSLKENMEGGFSRKTSPIWMDSSTSEECREITQALGGDAEVARRTGSTAFERFTGPQIRRFYKKDPQGYESTARIHLVSSFLASVLAGTDAVIDPGDGAGMNLMDIREKDWLDEALEATAPKLREKLPSIRESQTVVGPISPYFVQRYGFSSSCRCLVWSGDNPCSVIGLGLIKPGMTAISLGTSDTFMSVMSSPDVSEDGEGHVFGSPTGEYMTLICFKNGSLAREAVRKRFAMSWDQFSEALALTRPGNGGALFLPWFETEITPHVTTAGVHAKNLDESDGHGHCRAVVEGQMMAMKIHSAWAVKEPASIYVTGGASANREILQVMADVFQCTVYPFEITNGAGLGAALRAYHGVCHLAKGLNWRQAIEGFAVPDRRQAVRPRFEYSGVYEELTKEYLAFENEALKIMENG